VVRRITSLYRPVSVSASGGKIWVADLGDPAGSGTGSVVRYSTLGAVEATATSVNGPRSVVVDPVDANRAWVADTENGRLVLFDGATELSSTPGLDRPDVIAVHRGGP
jgi:DNA-binding beta-propeller fold protein YncE